MIIWKNRSIWISGEDTIRFTISGTNAQRVFAPIKSKVVRRMHVNLEIVNSFRDLIKPKSSHKFQFSKMLVIARLNSLKISHIFNYSCKKSWLFRVLYLLVLRPLWNSILEDRLFRASIDFIIEGPFILETVPLHQESSSKLEKEKFALKNFLIYGSY